MAWLLHGSNPWLSGSERWVKPEPHIKWAYLVTWYHRQICALLWIWDLSKGHMWLTSCNHVCYIFYIDRVTEMLVIYFNNSVIHVILSWSLHWPTTCVHANWCGSLDWYSWRPWIRTNPGVTSSLQASRAPNQQWIQCITYLRKISSIW